MKIYTYDERALTAVMNDGLDAYLKFLTETGVVTPTQAVNLADYRLMVTTPSMWGMLWAKASGKELDTLAYYVVKVEQ